MIFNLVWVAVKNILVSITCPFSRMWDLVREAFGCLAGTSCITELAKVSYPIYRLVTNTQKQSEKEDNHTSVSVFVWL